MKIRSLSRMTSALSTIDRKAGAIAKVHVDGVTRRLNSHVDVSGTPFIPYKEPARFPGRRPLEHAEKLFSDARLVVRSSPSSVEVGVQLVGRAAVIANYQNVRRAFLGILDEDKRAAVSIIFDRTGDRR